MLQLHCYSFLPDEHNVFPLFTADTLCSLGLCHMQGRIMADVHQSCFQEKAQKGHENVSFTGRAHTVPAPAQQYSPCFRSQSAVPAGTPGSSEVIDAYALVFSFREDPSAKGLASAPWRSHSRDYKTASPFCVLLLTLRSSKNLKACSVATAEQAAGVIGHEGAMQWPSDALLQKG